jgi:hypothetical protein
LLPAAAMLDAGHAPPNASTLMMAAAVIIA